MSQKLDNAVGRLGERFYQPPQTKRTETESNYEQSPPAQSNCEGPTTAWLSPTACSDDQQGSAKLNSVDIDRRGESGELSRAAPQMAGSSKEAEEVH